MRASPRTQPLPKFCTFPSLDYLAKEVPPKRIMPTRTTSGYERLPGVDHYPPAPRGSIRMRHDACLTRPERALSVQEIMAGALSGPDVERYKRQLAKQKMTSDQAAAARRRLRAAGRAAALTARLGRSPGAASGGVADLTAQLRKQTLEASSPLGSSPRGSSPRGSPTSVAVLTAHLTSKRMD